MLAAAKAVFSKGGAQASLEAVAKRAGVGIGTLYRHFPTRETLYEAVYQHEVRELVGLAERLNDQTAPVEALRRWMRSIVEFIATKKGMLAALALPVTASSELHMRSFELLRKAAHLLLDQAVAAGEIRSDIDPGDLVRGLIGMCFVHNQPGWQENVLPIVDVLVDGLRLPAKIVKAKHAGAVKRARSKRA